jgi:hypothetical protein
MHGVPGPAVLLTGQEASAVLGSPVRGTRLDLLGRLTIWRPADGWLLSSHSVVLCAGTLTARVTLTAPQRVAADAALARLVPLVAQRLRAAADR